MSKWTEGGVDGPLAVHIDGFGEFMAGLGYAAKSAAQQQLLMAHASDWLAARNLGVADFTELVMAEFAAGRRAGGHSVHMSVRGMSRMMDYLRSVGAVPGVVPAQAVTASEVLIERYVGYLVRERGLASTTVVAYTRAARLFLAERGVSNGVGLGSLSASDVIGYVLEQRQRGATASVRAVTSPLRCLLRFLFVEGLIDRDLVGAVPSGPDRRMNSLPKAIRAAEVARLLGSCDRDTVAGRRDFAMITVLSRLGLRAGETAALLLSDIDWRRGELVVVGKANRADRLPLPVDVGEAIGSWLQAGGRRDDRGHVFTRLRAPVGPLSNAGVSMVVSRASQRAGLRVMYAHCLRHTVATETLRAGGSLVEVAQLLRHSSVATTTTYARVDRVGLDAVVRPWPRGQS